MIKILLIITIGLISNLFAICGMLGGNVIGNENTPKNAEKENISSLSTDKIEVKFGKNSKTLDISNSYFSAWNHGEGILIYLSNYPLEISQQGEICEEKQPKSNEQLLLSISINKPGDDIQKKITEQTFQFDADASNAEEYAQNILLYYFAKGRQENVMFSRFDGNGTIKLTSVTKEQVTGEINYQSNDGSVKGNFTAKIFKESKNPKPDICSGRTG